MTLVDVRFEISSRPMVIKTIPVGERLAKVIVEAGEEFTRDTGRQAQFAYVLQIPVGVDEGKEVKGIMLVQADWVRPDQVAVGSGGMEVIDVSYRQWRKV
jgi:hypothetical protein